MENKYQLINWKFFETKELTNEYILFRLNEISKPLLELESENLKAIPNWIDIFEKDWDIYFTQSSAIREAELQGKKIPTIEQWGEIIKSINPNINLNWGWQNDTSVRIALWLKLADFRNPYGDFYGQGDFGYFWSSTAGRDVLFGKDQVHPTVGNDSEYAFSCRCLKN